jgi:hypothetical protein
MFRRPLLGPATEPFQAGDVNPAGGEVLPGVRLQVPVTAEREAVIDPEPIGMDHAARYCRYEHEMSRNLCLMLLCGLSTGSLPTISLRLPGR